MKTRILDPLAVFLVFSYFTGSASSASSTSFCKCVCGFNSTIIPLDGTPLDSSASRSRPSSPKGKPGTAIDESILPSEADRGNDANKIYDPADQGYTFPSADEDYFHRRQDDDGKSSPDSEPVTDGAPDAVDVPAPPKSSPPSGAKDEEEEASAGNSTETQLVSPKRAGTCNDCNRQFCLDHPDFGKMCGEAKEEEVFTTCFQRDSAKDQIVVYTFIIVTVGLLVYAAIRPWIEKKYAAVKERRTYVPVSGGQSGE